MCFMMVILQILPSSVFQTKMKIVPDIFDNDPCRKGLERAMISYIIEIVMTN